MTFTLAQIERALSLPDFDSLAAQQLMMPVPRAVQRPMGLPGKPRLGAVLLLLYCLDKEWHLTLTKRRDDLNSHAGQVSFPGGKQEDGESLRETALRETQEEIGVDPARVRLLGELATLYIQPSDFQVHPYVGWHPEPLVMVPDPREVAEILEVPLRHLLDPATQVHETWNLRGFEVDVPFYLIGSYKVWGATAMILSEFTERLRLLDAAGTGGPGSYPGASVSPEDKS